MFDALRDIACIVTAFISLLYGTRIAWGVGKKCQSGEKLAHRRLSLLEILPAAIVIYSFGFLVIFGHFVSGYLSLVIFSITSAILLAGVVVLMAMPERKQKLPVKKTGKELVLAEIKDGSICCMAKKAFNIFLEHDRIARFKRSDGWVVVGKDPLRQKNRNADYEGVERRETV